MRGRAIVLGLLVVCGPSCAQGLAHTGGAAASLETSAGTLSAACSASGMRTVRAAVHRVAGHRDPDGAWKLVRSLLCDKGPGAHRRVVASLARRANFRLEGNEPSVSVLSADSAEIAEGYAAGKAWGAQTESVDGDLSIQFSTGQTCWAGFLLHFERQRWLLAQLNSGCD